MDKSNGPGRPQGDLKGATAEANELATFLRQVTKELTVRQLAVQYMGGRTAWSLFRSGAQVIPLHLLEKVVRDQVPDPAARDLLLARARKLHERTAAATPDRPVPLPLDQPRAAPRRRRWLTHLVVAGVAVLVSVVTTIAVTRPATTSANPTPEPAASELLVALSGDGVRAYDPATGRWTRIGDPAESVHGGPEGLAAVSPVTGHVVLYRAPGNWSYIGERAAEVAVGRAHVYRLAPDRAAVWEWSEDVQGWRLAGGPARHVYAGQAGVFASGPDGRALFRYEGTPGKWTFVTNAVGPEDTILVGAETIYRLPVDRSAVFEWRPESSQWSRIGGPARSIHAGGAGLFMIAPDGGLHAYRDGSWTHIGDGGADVAVGGQHVYRRMPDDTLAKWTPAGSTWTDLGTRARSITVAGW